MGKFNLKKATSTAKNVVLAVPKTVLSVPRAVGRTILSVPDTVVGVVNKNKKNLDQKQPQHAEELLEVVNRDIVEDQQRREIVRESQSVCMNTMENHLETFLISTPDKTYEEWIQALHPDNAEYAENTIDHRFYLESSHHRLLWNDYMTKMMNTMEDNWSNRIVEAKTIDPSYNRTT